MLSMGHSVSITKGSLRASLELGPALTSSHMDPKPRKEKHEQGPSSRKGRDLSRTYPPPKGRILIRGDPPSERRGLYRAHPRRRRGLGRALFSKEGA